MSLAYTDILYCFYRAYTVNLRISARGAYLKFRRTQEALIRRGAYLIFRKSWPDKITFLLHYLRINTSISCLLTKKLILKLNRGTVSTNVFNVFTKRVHKLHETMYKSKTA